MNFFQIDVHIRDGGLLVVFYLRHGMTYFFMASTAFAARLFSIESRVNTCTGGSPGSMVV